MAEREPGLVHNKDFRTMTIVRLQRTDEAFSNEEIESFIEDGYDILGGGSMKTELLLRISEQTTCETCLSSCLIALLRYNGIKVNDSEELKIMIEGLKLTKLDYSTGQLAYVCDKYNVNIEQYVDYPIFYKILSKLKYTKKLKLISKKVDMGFLKRLIKNSPIIVYMDKYYLDGIYHYSHFVILKSIGNRTSIILDPWDGKEKKIETALLIRSIQSLRNKLKISPKAIRIV